MIVLSMSVLFLAVGVFLSLFLFQALLWHFVDMPHPLWILFGIFLIGPIAFYNIGVLSFSGLFFALLLSANYISAFPVLQASSPTLVILELIYREKGITKEALLKQLLGYGLVSDRLSDLEAGALIVRKGDDYTLTSKGNYIATFFVLFRRCLALPEGVG